MAKDAVTRRDFFTYALGAISVAANTIACTSNADPQGPPQGEIREDDPILAGNCEAPSGMGDSCALTNTDIEGPFYLPESPERSDLGLLGDAGVPLLLSGVVTDEGCSPIPDAIVEVWHASPTGEYDNTPTMHYRGWVRTDGSGAYAFTTLVPGRYLNQGTLRPSHVHMKVWRGGQEDLTTQVYFMDDPQIPGDPWAEPERTVCLTETSAGMSAIFDVALLS